MYEPKPQDTSKIELPPQLEPLVEWLAEHVHEIWAKQRIDDGWTFGPERSDKLKTHPSLIPYDELPESEKVYDRNTALETIKVIMAKGATIEFDSDRFSADDQAIEQTWNNTAVPAEASKLVAFWEERPANPTLITPEKYRDVAKAFKRNNAFIKMYDILETGLAQYETDVAMRQMFGDALNKIGAHERARDEMERLLERTGDVPGVAETCGILGSAYKSLGQKATTVDDRRRFLEQSRDSYARGFASAKKHDNIGGQVYTGPNAATVSLLLEDLGAAQAIAEEVLQICAASNSDDYWTVATLAECHLLCGHMADAETYYKQAGKFTDVGAADKATTRRQARLILDQLDKDPALIDTWMPAGDILIFRGHMLDRPGKSPRFTPDKEAFVAEQIRKKLDALPAPPIKAFASATAGSDIIFIEEMQRRGHSVQIILPFGIDEFKATSVAYAGGDWCKRFDHVLNNASHEPVIASRHCPKQTDIVFDYANQLMIGWAMNDAERLDTQPRSLVVWDGRPSLFAGGVSALVEFSKRQGFACGIIELPTDRSPSSNSAADNETDQSIRALLFADVKGFSKLHEQELPAFCNDYIRQIGELCDKYEGDQPERSKLNAKNTWGDGLFFVFPSILDAARFAFELCRLTADTDWKARGFSNQLAIRVALHAGPVYAIPVDPVTGMPNVMGNHVSQAARIEPITPENHIYASDAFAALIKAENITEFVCDYVGPTSLAKGYGTFPTYHVRRRAVAE